MLLLLLSSSSWLYQIVVQRLNALLETSWRVQESRTISWTNTVTYGLNRPCQLKSVLSIPQKSNGQISLTLVRGSGAKYFGINCRRRFLLSNSRATAESSNDTSESEENRASQACPAQIGAMEQDGVTFATSTAKGRQRALHDIAESVGVQMTRMASPRMSRQDLKAVDLSSERKRLQTVPVPSPCNSIDVSIRAQTNTGLRINFACKKSF